MHEYGSEGRQMGRLKSSTEATTLPDRRLVGTPLIHYGPLWEPPLDQPRGRKSGPIAVLVCHGMGQQVRYETISSVAQAICHEARQQGNRVRDVEVHVSKHNDSFLGRAELSWTDSQNNEHTVHIYEAYWAPLTEGRVTYRDTVQFLLAAAWNGLRYSAPFTSRTFLRWMFGAKKEMKISRTTFFALIGVLAFLLLQLFIIGFVILELAQQYKMVIAQPFSLANLHDWLRWLVPFFPEHATLLQASIFSQAWWWAFGKLLARFALIAEALVARYFIVQYVGDVAAYISPYKDSKFDELRHRIQKVGLDVGKVVYGFGQPNFAVPNYGKILFVGHSLGSVLAYDTLNALINLDNVSPSAGRREVVNRTRALITFGSPLDKTAFIFRMQPKNEQDWIREQLAASVQPLIVDYALYRPPSFEWVNIWSPRDIISGELNYYDDPNRPPNQPPCVQNVIDTEATVPLAAHVQYWHNAVLRERLYGFVS